MAELQYAFRWDFVGNLQLGRPDLGPLSRVECYRLLQFSLRDVLEKHFGAQTTESLFHEAGFLAGGEFFQHVVGSCATISEFFEKTRAAMESLRMGILRMESSDMQTKQFVLTVGEDLSCSGLPDVSREICFYEEGFLAGLFTAFMGEPFVAHEKECWCNGSRFCRFEVSPSE